MVGARPNFVKMAAILNAFEAEGVRAELVHTGQHYDHAMSGRFFDDLGLPSPDRHLAIGSGTHSEQTAGVLVAYEQHLASTRPDLALVVGDVNATLAAALAAAKLGIPVAHVEAGLRSFDWSMPEEVNRVLTDRMSEWLFTPSADANENLRVEGIPSGRIRLVGNTMIDTLFRLLPSARSRFGELAESVRLPEKYAVVTLHRPSNVDDEASLRKALHACELIAEMIPVIFPLHPRTRLRLEQRCMDLVGRVVPIDPLGYLEFVSLLDRSSLVITDSGGIQEETSALGVPCLTFRDSTERPVTVTHGTNRVVGTDPDRVAEAASEALSRSWQPANIPLWDGNAATRIVHTLLATQ